MKLFRMISQLGILCVLNEIGKWCSAFFHLPIPGSIIGMLLLLILLVSGILKERLLIDGAGFLLKHFSFFFLPLSVSVVILGPYLLNFGWKLLLIVVISALAGFLATSLSAEHLIQYKEKRKHDLSH